MFPEDDTVIPLNYHRVRPLSLKGAGAERNRNALSGEADPGLPSRVTPAGQVAVIGHGLGPSPRMFSMRHSCAMEGSSVTVGGQD